jgi:hypothetical protein
MTSYEVFPQTVKPVSCFRTYGAVETATHKNFRVTPRTLKNLCATGDIVGRGFSHDINPAISVRLQPLSSDRSSYHTDSSDADNKANLPCSRQGRDRFRQALQIVSLPPRELEGAALRQRARVAGPRIAAPAHSFQAAAERTRHLWRKIRLHVGKPLRGGRLTRGFVQRPEPLPAAARRTVVWIGEQIRFRREPQQRGHARAALVFNDRAHQKQRIARIGQRVAEALRRVHRAQSGEIGVGVRSNEHGICTSGTRRRVL